jgi:hypothetical protein
MPVPQNHSRAKRKGRAACAPRPVILKSGLERLNVGSLQALGAADNLEFNGLSLIERAIAVRLNRGEMDEYVLTRLALNKTKSLAGVKPLHCSLFFHRCVSFNYKSYLMHSFTGDLLRGDRASFADSPDTAVKRSEKQKRPQVDACDPLKQKAKQEQQTHLHNSKD